MHDARECAVLLLTTVPALMRSLHCTLRQSRPTDEEIHTLGQMRMLEMLQRGSYTLSELAAGHHVAPSTMSRSVDLLVRKAWVARQHDPKDRRQILLSLTEEGRAALRAMRQQTQEALTQLLEQLDERGRTQLYDGLSVLQSLLIQSDRLPTSADQQQS
jgi:DNA-binding MarR family transcriptional regulator